MKTGEVTGSVIGGFYGSTVTGFYAGATTAAILGSEENLFPVAGQIAYGVTVLIGGAIGAGVGAWTGHNITQIVYNWTFKQLDSIEIPEEDDSSEDLPAYILPGEPGYPYMV